MNDYIIAVDSNGQPYIEHAFGRNRGANAQHKYILKIGEGAKARYFYTQEAVRAYLQNTGANASERTKEFLRKNIPGYRERETAISTRAAADQAERERASSAAKYSKAVDTELAARDSYRANRSAESAKNYALATNRTEAAAQEYYGTDNSEGKLDKANAASDKAIKAITAYRETPLYKLEEFSKHPIKSIADALSDTVDDAIWSIEDKYNSIVSKVEARRNARTDAKREAAMQSDPKVVKARNAYSEAESEYNRANTRFMMYVMSSDSEKGSAEWTRLEGELDRAARHLDWALEDLNSAESKYNKRR